MAWNPITLAGEAIMAILGRLWQGWKDVLLLMWNFALKGWTWLVGLFWIFVVAIVAMVNAVHDMLGTLLTKINALVMPSPNAVREVGDMLSVANTFFPVVEGFAILGLLCGLWGLALVYRFVKSWVPLVD